MASTFAGSSTGRPRPYQRGDRAPMRLEELPPRVDESRQGARLAGRVAVITGAAGELGGAIARHCAEEGCSVALTDVDIDGVQAAAGAIRSTQDMCRVMALELDATCPRSWRRAMRTIRGSLGGPDLLVNSAGVIELSGLDDLTTEAWGNTVAVNQTAVWHGIRSCLPTMWLAGGGSIVNVGSVFGSLGSGASFAYHTTKGALEAMTVAAAVELAPRRIRVNAVLPGAVRSGLIRDLPAGVLDRFRHETPLGCLAEPDDVAAAAVFLGSEQASFITGTCLRVDGGFSAR